MDIGKRIKELREMNNMRSGDFADKIGISSVFLSYMESGTKKPSYETLEKICSVLNISLSQFFSEGEEPISLTPELKELLDNARHLSPEKVSTLNTFIEQFALGHKPKYVKTQVNGEEMHYVYNEDERPPLTKAEEDEANELADRIIELARQDPEKKKQFEEAGFKFDF
jgi:transcriptional regulator with XRE-family HTH domain